MSIADGRRTQLARMLSYRADACHEPRMISPATTLPTRQPQRRARKATPSPKVTLSPKVTVSPLDTVSSGNLVSTWGVGAARA